MTDYLQPAADPKCDRTEEIRERLETTGFCRLAPGDYCVKNLVMPQGSSLFGCGNCTRIFLSEDLADGFAVRLQAYCSVRDFQLIGAADGIEPAEQIGTRHGLIWCGHYSEDKTDCPHRGSVEGLYIHGFSGGGITANDTGYNVDSGMNVVNCYVWNCGAGINLAFWTEFHRFTNVHSARNYYGCINNGGNNVFVNCCFSGNRLGFLMDNHDGKAKNNSHGNVLGCTFDHSDHNTGTGIRILNMKTGYCFTGCQVFFSKIEVIDSEGVVFSDIDAGKNEEIIVSGGGWVMFENCMYKVQPTIRVTDNDHVQFVNCHLRSGEEIEHP